MNLEVASYIAGIVAAVAGVWSVYYARAQVKGNSGKSAPPTAADGTAATTGVPLVEQPFPATPPKQEEEPCNFVNITGVPEELVLAFKTTDTMFNKPKRDAALKALIMRSVQLGYVEFSIGLASRMWHKPTKDAVLNYIVEAALSANQVQLAHEASEHYFNMPNKDAAKTKIIGHVSRA